MREKIFFILCLSFLTCILLADCPKTVLDFIEPTDVVTIECSNDINIWENEAAFSIDIRPLTADNNGRIAYQENNWELYTEEIQRNAISIIFVRNYSNSDLIVRTNSTVPMNEWTTLSVTYIDELPVISFNGEQVELTVVNDPRGKALNSRTDLLIGNDDSFHNFDGYLKNAAIQNGRDELSINLITEEIENSEILTTVEDDVEITNSVLFQNFPNPVVNSTTIKFNVKTASDCSVAVYNVKGQKVVTLFDERVESNETISLNWNGTNANGSKISSGIYLYKLVNKRESIINKMVIN